MRRKHPTSINYLKTISVFGRLQLRFTSTCLASVEFGWKTLSLHAGSEPRRAGEGDPGRRRPKESSFGASTRRARPPEASGA
jgi:hypothetical protein